MADEQYRHPRLASIYDALDPDRSDLEPYLAIAEELGARRVLDVGCGTGTLALMLAERGMDVVGVDPAAASIAVARNKPGAQRVCWIDGTTAALPASESEFDLAVMTGNATQSITEPEPWQATLRDIRAALRPGGYLVFETRDPAARGWERWTREASYRTTDVPGVGEVASWVEVTGFSWPLVCVRWRWNFASDGAALTSESTFRFRTREEVEADLHSSGYSVLDVRDAPERPGLEYVFVAQRNR